MLKKYIVRLTDEERKILQEVVAKLKGSSQKVRRAQVLLKADADGPAWTDARIAEAFGCRTKTVENIRQRLVTEGFAITLHGQALRLQTHQWHSSLAQRAPPGLAAQPRLVHCHI